MGPEIAPGVAGIAVLTATARVLALLVPQELLAVTEMFPLAALPDVETTIERITPRKGCDTVFSDRAQTAGGASSVPDGAAHQPASDTNRTSCLNRSILRF